MKPVAETLSKDFGVLECLQTEKSINRQIKELHKQLTSSAEIPTALIGFSWGALAWNFVCKQISEPGKETDFDKLRSIKKASTIRI